MKSLQQSDDADHLNKVYVDCLDRASVVGEIKKVLENFATKRADLMFKRGIYLYGPSGSGKTELVLQILAEMNYSVVTYDTGDVRNKSLIESITNNNMSDRNVLSMMQEAATEKTPEPRRLAVLMDEIDGMNHSDKGGINTLIRVIRQKKTKKQKSEEIAWNPIICIGNYYTDKKVRELMRVCHTFELKRPTQQQMVRLVMHLLAPQQPANIDAEKIAQYVQGDLRKLNAYIRMYKQNRALCLSPISESVLLKQKSFVDNVKSITKRLFTRKHEIPDHSLIMNETDRTTVALLLHENIIDAIAAAPMSATATTELRLRKYQEILQNICFSDYMDRITFQSQIWQFNELTSLIKTFYNHSLFHAAFPGTPPLHDIRFTKVLTKYSTEYNNTLFVYGLCQQLELDQSDLVTFFHELRNNVDHALRRKPQSESPSPSPWPPISDTAFDAAVVAHAERTLEPYNVSKLLIKRMYRYLDVPVRGDAPPPPLPLPLLPQTSSFCGSGGGGGASNNDIDIAGCEDELLMIDETKLSLCGGGADGRMPGGNDDDNDDDDDDCGGDGGEKIMSI